MDLIYAKPDKTEIGVVMGHTLDLAYGIDENEFELTVSLDNDVCGQGYLIYMDGTDYGGVIDSKKVDTEAETVKYIGRTWHGVMEAKVLKPDANQDYLYANGEANTVLWTLVQRMGLTSIFERDTTNSGITISNHRFERYPTAYTAIREMLSKYSAKLILTIDRPNSKVKISAKRAVDWSINEPIDSDLCDFEIERKFRPVNHLVCLGEGELKDRIVLHLYADANGNVSQTQTLTGIDEVEEVYDFSNSDLDELLDNGTERLQGYQEASEIKVNLDTERTYDVGDIVTATDKRTNTSVTTVVSKKIVNVEDDIVTVDYEVGGYTDSQIKAARKAADDASTAIRAAAAAAAAAAIAQAETQDKPRVFTERPTPPYKVGDLWIQGANGDILVCTTSKEE